MNNRASSGLQDDEALLTYLLDGKEPLRWQLVYTRFRAAQPPEMSAPHMAKAFATWLDDLRGGHFSSPLQDSLQAIFLAYLNPSPTDQPLPYLAGDTLTLALEKDRENTHNALVKSYRKPARAILEQRQPISEADFADAYQNAQVNLLEKPPSHEQALTAQLFSWFMRVLVRRVVDWQRKNKKTPAAISPEEAQYIQPLVMAPSHDQAYWDSLIERYQIDQRFGDDDAQTVLKTALQQLEAGCQDLIHKRYILNYAYKKIAEQNEYSVDSVGQRIKRCLKKLRLVLTATNA